PVILVAILLGVVAWNVMADIQLYGDLKYYRGRGWRGFHETRRSLATQYLFHSLSGSILYGHGKPRTISSKVKVVVVVLSDVLFLTITQQLLNILRCDYSVSGTDEPLLIVS